MCSIHYHKFPSKYWNSKPSNAIIRSYFHRNKMFPTATDVKDSLGAVMAEIFFSTLPDEVKECIGLGSPLTGPKGKLWISPLDDPNVPKFTEVPSPNLEQSLSHATILKIGEKYEEHQYDFLTQVLGEAVSEKEKEMAALLEQKIKEVREKTKCEFFYLYSLRMKDVFNKLKKQFEDLLAEKERAIRRELEKEKEEALDALKKSMECEMQNMIKELNSSSETKLKFMTTWNENINHEEFKAQSKFYMKRWSALFRCAKENSDRNVKRAMGIAHVHHNNLAMKALQKERNRFYQVLSELLRFFQGRLKDLTDELNSLRDFIERINLEREGAAFERKTWECTLKDLLDQFQKFINYVLQEVPGQANYLLSLSEICKNRKECLKKAKNFEQFDTVGHKPANWGEVIREAKPEESKANMPLAQSSVCEETNWTKKSVKETPVEIEESLCQILNEQKKRVEYINWTKYLVSWITERMEGNQGLPEIPKPPSESGSVDSELGRYAEQYFNFEPSGRPKPQQGLDHLTAEGDQFSAGVERSLRIVGEEIKDDRETEGFTDRRVNSIVNILASHPELRNVIIKLFIFRPLSESVELLK